MNMHVHMWMYAFSIVRITWHVLPGYIIELARL